MSVDLDGLADLIDASMPWLELWVFGIALALGVCVLVHAIEFARRRYSPVERLARRRRA